MVLEGMKDAQDAKQKWGQLNDQNDPGGTQRAALEQRAALADSNSGRDMAAVMKAARTPVVNAREPELVKEAAKQYTTALAQLAQNAQRPNSYEGRNYNLLKQKLDDTFQPLMGMSGLATATQDHRVTTTMLGSGTGASPPAPAGSAPQQAVTPGGQPAPAPAVAPAAQGQPPAEAQQAMTFGNPAGDN
jgi:hypothetical protein